MLLWAALLVLAPVSELLDSFPPPVLIIRPPEPSEGSQMTLTCKTSLSTEQSEKTHLLFRFCVFKNKSTCTSDWSINPETQVATVWSKDPVSYWCEARTASSEISKKSRESQVQVQRILATITIRIRPDSRVVFEGQELVLRCTVTGVPETFSVSWFRAQGPDLQFPALFSSKEEVRFSSVETKDAGGYYCVIKKGQVSWTSETVTITVKVPVSTPVFTLTSPRTQTLEGDMVTLDCEVSRGSLPIHYQFFIDGVLLDTVEGLWQRRSSFSFAVTAEHSGSYSCSADNGLRPQFSQHWHLFVTVPVSNPVLTMRTPGSQTLEGDTVTLDCQAQRGSPPVYYQLHHQGATQQSIPVYEGGATFTFTLTTEHSGSYYCSASNGFGAQSSEPISLSVIVPVCQPVLTLRTPRAQAVVGDVLELHCEAHRGSAPILYSFYHGDVSLGSNSTTSGGGVSFSLSLTTEHSGSYSCEAYNGVRSQRSERMLLNVTAPVSQPVLTLSTPRARAAVGDVLELHCQAQRGSPPILYWFYHENFTLGSSCAPSGGGVSFSLHLKAEHSGSFSCKAENVAGAQHSAREWLSVRVPVSKPALTLRRLGARAAAGAVMELHCEAPGGSPPMLFSFYHEDAALGSSLAPAGGGASFNLSLTSELSGNYSCVVENDLGAQRSESLPIFITGLAGRRSVSVATGVTGGLLSVVALALATLLFLRFRRGKVAGRRPASAAPRTPPSSDAQDPTYHNVPAWIQLQPVYSNVNLQGGDVVYTEVRKVPEKSKHAAASSPRPLKDEDTSVIYSQVKTASTPVSAPQHPALAAPQR